MERNETLQWAHLYGQLEWFLLPVCWVEDGRCAAPEHNKNGKTCESPGKSPLTHWGTKSSDDRHQIDIWWSKWPKANIGVDLGKSRMFVMDVEAESMDAFAEYEMMGEGFPETLVSKTGGGGVHIFFQLPPGGVKNSTNKFIIPHVDIKGPGGMVVLPPSSHMSGGGYEWQPWAYERVRAGRLAAAAPRYVLDHLKQLVNRNATGRKGGAADNGYKWEEFQDAVFEPGGRNDALFAHACKFRRQAAVLGVTEQEIRSVCTAVFVRSGLGEEEIRKTLDSAFDREDENIIDAETAEWARNFGSGVSDSESLENPETDPLEDLDEGPFPLTDLGNARRMRKAYRSNLRYVDGSLWHVYDGRLWSPDDGAANAKALELNELVEKEAAAAVMAGNQNLADDLLKWAKYCSNDTGMEKVVRTLRKMPSMRVSSRQFNRYPELLMVQNGVLDLKKAASGIEGALRAPKRTDFLSRESLMRYDRDAECPRWEEFMETIIPDAQTRWLVQKGLGYTMTGLTDAHCFFICYGSGRNGKSMMLDTIADLLNRDKDTGFAWTIDKSLVVNTRYKEHSTVEIALEGKRMAIASDLIGTRDKLNDSMLKRLATGEMLSAHEMREASENIQTTVTVWIAANTRPALTETSEAMKRRVRFIPFTHQFTEDTERSQSEVRAEFLEESAGILNWLLRGLEGYYEEGLEDSSLTRAEKIGYFDSNDVIGEFVREYCQKVHVVVGMKTSVLHSAYVEWAKKSGYRPVNINIFRNDLKDRPDVLNNGEWGRGRVGRFGLRLWPLDQNGVPIVDEDPTDLEPGLQQEPKF